MVSVGRQVWRYSGMSEKEKDRMFNQMEQFEGPERKEVRGDECEPEKDPGVAHS